MAKRTEQSRNLELFREAFSDFQDLASGASLSRQSATEICHGRSTVVWGWKAFSDALDAYSVATGQREKIKNSGVAEVIKTMTSNHTPDELLVLNGHYLFKKFTFNDLGEPGEFLLGLETPELERATAFCIEIFNVGLIRNDLDLVWPIVPLDEELWKVLNQSDRDFMKQFVTFESAWGGVPGNAIDNFTRTKIVKSEIQYRYLLGKMLDIGLVSQKPLEEMPVYESSKENLDFFGFK